jgi:hypothetical protein
MRFNTLGFLLCTPGACIIKLFTVVITFVVQQASAFAIVSHFLPVLTSTLASYVTELITAILFLLTHLMF